MITTRTTENAELIAKGARTLVEMSEAEKWQVKNNSAYRQFSGEFQRTAKNLVEAAVKGNFDAATLKWIDTTIMPQVRSKHSHCRIMPPRDSASATSEDRSATP